MALYDSAKVRVAAGHIKQVAASFDESVKPGMRGVFDCIEDLRGKTAEAMEEQMTQLWKTAGGISDELNELAVRVNAYAIALEQTDAQLAEEL